MKPLPKLTPIQQRMFEAELSAVISAPRWFCVFGVLEDDCTEDCGVGDPHLAEIRHSGMFVPEHQAIFNEKLSECCSHGRWFCAFGTLEDNEDLTTRVRSMNLPPTGSQKAAILHAAIERLVFESLRQGEAWTRRMPHSERIYRAIASGVFEGLESRKKIGVNGNTGVNGDVQGKMNMGGGLIIGHGLPVAKPEDVEDRLVFPDIDNGEEGRKKGWWK